MRIKENFDLIIGKYPYYESINKKLLKDMEKATYPAELCYSDKYKFNAIHSAWNTSSENIDKINSWILDLVYCNGSFDNRRLEIKDNWFSVYKKGNWVGRHNHFLSLFSWVYFIRTPRGSSPLVFSTSGKRIKAEEGKVVIFPANILHHVPDNKSDGRVVLVGNVESYRPNDFQSC